MMVNIPPGSTFLVALALCAAVPPPAADAYTAFAPRTAGGPVTARFAAAPLKLSAVNGDGGGGRDRQSFRSRARRFGSLVRDRMDAYRAAGFYDDGIDGQGAREEGADGFECMSVSVDQRSSFCGAPSVERKATERKGVVPAVPMYSGFKTNVGLFVAAWLFKWYRARFINKIPVWDRQPQWNMVVTKPEQEKELKAYMCKNCGATLFIARHREWFFEREKNCCTNCGATGKDNFVDIRDEVIDEIDDDYFDYESPLDFVSAAERRKLIKEAGGDEEKAKELAVTRAMEADPEMVDANDAAADEGGESEAAETSDEGEMDLDVGSSGPEEDAEENNVEVAEPAESVVEEVGKPTPRESNVEAAEPVAEAVDTPTTKSSAGDDSLDELDMDAF